MRALIFGSGPAYLGATGAASIPCARPEVIDRVSRRSLFQWSASASGDPLEGCRMRAMSSQGRLGLLSLDLAQIRPQLFEYTDRVASGRDVSPHRLPVLLHRGPAYGASPYDRQEANQHLGRAVAIPRLRNVHVRRVPRTRCCGRAFAVEDAGGPCQFLDPRDTSHTSQLEHSFESRQEDASRLDRFQRSRSLLAVTRHEC